MRQATQSDAVLSRLLHACLPVNPVLAVIRESLLGLKGLSEHNCLAHEYVRCRLVQVGTLQAAGSCTVTWLVLGDFWQS